MYAPRAVVAAAVGLLLGGSVLSAVPAAASTPAIQVSTDGSTWSSSIASPLFAGYQLVPNDSTTRTFYVRNNAPSAGYLRLTVRDVTTDNLDFGDALSLRADLHDWPGSVVPVSSARPCARLAEGPVIASGGTAQVDLTALLGDLDGQHGQNASASFQIIVSISEVPSGLGDSGCPDAGTALPAVSGTASGASTPLYRSASGGWESTTQVASAPTTTAVTAEPSPTPTSAPIPLQAERASTNTERLYQEYTVALWLIGALLGGVIAVVRRRKNSAAPDSGTHPKGALR